MLGNYEHLYLKEYFSNFFLRKNHHQQTSLLKSSLQVLSELVASFIRSHAVPYQKEASFYKTNSQQQLSLQNLFQELYCQIKTVFQWVDQNGRKCLDESRVSILSERDKLSTMMPVCGDDELYGMLNEYKIENKKLRNQNKDLQHRIQKLDKQNRKNENQMKQQEEDFDRKTEILQSQCEELLKRIEALKIEIKQKQNESELLQNRIDELEIQVKRKQNELINLEHDLEQSLRETEKIRRQIEQKEGTIRSVSAEYEQRLKQMEEKIPKMIQDKLSSNKNWQMPVYQGLLRFIKTTNLHKQQENRNPNQ